MPPELIRATEFTASLIPPANFGGLPEFGWAEVHGGGVRVTGFQLQKNDLTYSHMGMYCTWHGKGSDNNGCLQRSRRASPTGDLELPGHAGALGWGYRGGLGNGAAFGLQASSSSAGCGARLRATRRAAHALSNQRRSDPAAP